MTNNKWTTYIKNLRINSRYSLREAARLLDVSAPYLYDVENGNRVPTEKLVYAIIYLYNLDDDNKKVILDSAAEAIDSIPYDVIEFLKNNPEAIQEVRDMMKDKKYQLKK